MSEATALERALILCDDLATLKPDERIAYYKAVCTAAGLNPETKPLNFLTLEGKLVLYAGREATDQLRKLHGVSVVELTKEIIDGLEGGKLLHIVVKVSNKDGRTDISSGAVALGTLKGDALANAFMKAETKAKRRATLSICGLGVLDESELDTIPPTKTLLPAQDNTPKPLPVATVAPAVNQAPAPPVPPAPTTGLFANTTPPDPAHETTRFPQIPPAAPAPVVVAPPPAPKPAPAPTSVPPVAVAPPPVVSQPAAPPVAAIPLAVPKPATVVPTTATAPAPAPVAAAAPPIAPIATGADAPATPEEYQKFVGQRAAKLVRDKLAPAGLKQAGDVMKNYLLKLSGKAQLKQISAATFERLLAVLENATAEQAVELAKEGTK